MAYIGKRPSDINRAIATYDTFTGDGSTTAFDLTLAAGSANDIIVVVNNVRQEPGTSKSYTLGVDGNGALRRVTFNVAPASADEIYVINPTRTESIAFAGNVTSNVIIGQTAESTVADDDVVLVYDTSAGALRKITKANFAPTVSSDKIIDADSNTQIQVEESADENIIRFDTAGTERLTMDADGKFAFTSAGGGVINSTTVSNTYTITNQNLLLAGPVTLTGTITVGSGATMVVV